jgi:DNA (cytosine-5)-methyltransferase 1
MAVYYNEIEPYAAQWLRNLIKEGHIADGEVDTRSIVDVHPFDLQGFDQCHFFAGIGGWSHALRLAGWPDSRPVWTGSCPCQPFSVAGKGGGVTDKRHLWPEFHRLIRACRPPVVMGEQVAGKAGYGWFDGVRADLEGIGYAGRAVDIPALAVNAPHIRQRLYWVSQSMEHTNVSHGKRSGLSSGVYPQHDHLDGGSPYSHMADAPDNRPSFWPHPGAGWSKNERRRDADFRGEHLGSGSSVRDVADAKHLGLGGGTVQRSMGKSTEEGRMFQSEGLRSASPFWDDHIWLTGSDGKSRRSQPGLPLLAYGVSNRVGRLRAYGNAIVPPLAAEVIKAFMMGDDKWM